MSPPRLSCARRFVLVDTGGQVVADGVLFAGGPVVLHSRATGTAEVYPATALQLAPFVDRLEWIDAERPTPCATKGRPPVVDNQHQLIKGYRDLTPEEIAAMNRIKELEAQTALLWHEIKGMGTADPRCISETRTCLQDAFMWFVRAVARPDSPFDEE